MSLRSIVFSSLFSLCLAAPVLAIGCAAPTDADDSEGQVEETQDELTAAASQLLGSYYTQAPGFGGFARLELKATWLETFTGTSSLVSQPTSRA